MQSTVLRAQLESVLGERIVTPFTDLDKRVRETVPSGIDAFDAKIKGLPRGAITEIFGSPSSGKTSMLLSILAAATAREEVCTLVDGSDSFCPESGADAGIDLKRLLWVRCHTLDQTLKVADLLLQGGGFGVVALDLSDLSTDRVPLATWFRFQRSIEKTPTILVLISQEGVAKTCASLAVRMEGQSRGPGAKAPGRPHFEFAVSVPHTVLFEAAGVAAEIIRNRQVSSDSRSSYVCFSFHSSFSRPGARP